MCFWLRLSHASFERVPDGAACPRIEQVYSQQMVKLTAAENHRHTVETHERRIQYMGEHPDRFTDADRAQVTAGKCLQQTGYGLPWIEYCPDAPDGNSLLCARHRAENTEQYGAHTFGVTI